MLLGFSDKKFEDNPRKGSLSMINNIVEFINTNRETLDLVIDLVPIPLFIKNREGQYIDCNSAFTKFWLISREKIIGKTVYDLWQKEEADVFFAQDNELFEQGGLQIYETQVTSSNGRHHIVQFHKQVFTDSSGAIAGFLGVIFDITEKKNLEQALLEKATIDELTGLQNRRDGIAQLEVLHKDSARKKRPYCIAMIDIDHFKLINDQYGHTNGDIVLRLFANLVKTELRSSDVCFRYGGEEFVILLPETQLDEGYTVVERLRQVWAGKRLTLSDYQSVHSTVSIGLAQCNASSTSFEQMLQICDKVLYDAKSGGRNRIVCLV